MSPSPPRLAFVPRGPASAIAGTPPDDDDRTASQTQPMYVSICPIPESDRSDRSTLISARKVLSLHSASPQGRRPNRLGAHHRIGAVWTRSEGSLTETKK